MHLFLTGGTGFFGKALLRHWAAAQPSGLVVTILSRATDKFKVRHSDLLGALDVRFVEGDVTQPDTLPQSGEYTHILHAATDSTRGLTLSPLARYNQIVNGTRHVLEMAVRLSVTRVLLTSSGGVYGPQPASLSQTPETYLGMPEPLNAHNAYSIGKRVAEHLCALYADQYGLEPVIARCFAFVGEDLPLDAHFAIGNFLRDVLDGRDIEVQGDGTPIRSYLDQRDLARWLCILLQQGKPLTAYNVGSDQAVSIADLAKKIARHGQPSASSVWIQKEPVVGQAAERNRYVPDISRARNELGLGVTFGLEEAIEHTLMCHRASGIPRPC